MSDHQLSAAEIFFSLAHHGWRRKRKAQALYEEAW
jgi:hypothetical protein